MFEVVICCPGATQGTVLSLFLSTCHLQMFSDDTAIVGYVSDKNEQEYRDVIKDFFDSCECYHLHLNTSKTKEMADY